MYLDCGLTCGTRTSGTPWARSQNNNARARRFQATQPRAHFTDDGEVVHGTRPRPYNYSIRTSFECLQAWTQSGYRLWITRDDLTEIMNLVLNPNKLLV